MSEPLNDSNIVLDTEVDNTTEGEDGGNERNTDLLQLFECPVCFEYALPPIYQCKSGHITCFNCYPQIEDCPSCRGRRMSIRNRALETLAESVEFPCQYADQGCPELILYTEKAQHEENCRKRPCPCPFARKVCEWSGPPDQVLEHVSTCSGIQVIQSTGVNISFTVGGIVDPLVRLWVLAQSCHGENFIFSLIKVDKHEEDLFYAFVRYLGGKNAASKFRYNLQLSEESTRLMWEAIPESIYDSVETIVQDRNCLSFDAVTAKKFSKNSELTFNVAITQETLI